MTSIVNPPYLYCTTEEEFKQIFEAELVNGNLKFHGYDLMIISDDFYHICFERGLNNEDKAQFGIRRSRRILFIKAICDGALPYKIIHQTTRENKSICVICEELETAIYLKPIVSSSGNYFKLLTLITYGENVSKRIEKQLSQGEIIDDINIVFTEAV